MSDRHPQVHDDQDPCCSSVQTGSREITAKLVAMSWPKKVSFLSVVLALLSVSTALCVMFYRLEATTLILGIDDQRLLMTGTGDFSALFCSSYDLDVSTLRAETAISDTAEASSSERVSASILTGKPAHHQSSFTRSYEMELVSDSDYQFWAYYLENHARVDITVTCQSNSHIEMHIIQGENDLFDWIADSKRDRDCSDCIFLSHTFSCSGSTSSSSTYSFPTTSSQHAQEYAFVFQASTPTSSAHLNASVMFLLHRPVYTYSQREVVSECQSVPLCVLSVPNNARYLIMEMPGKSTVSSVAITTGCSPKAEMYVTFFFIIPVALLLILAGLVVTLKKCHDDVMRDTQNADNARGMQLLASTSPPQRPPSTSASHRHVSRSQHFTTAPHPHRLLLIDHDQLDSETTPADPAVRPPPEYNTIAITSTSHPPRVDAQSVFEQFATTPPPDYSNVVQPSDNDHDDLRTARSF